MQINAESVLACLVRARVAMAPLEIARSLAPEFTKGREAEAVNYTRNSLAVLFERGCVAKAINGVELFIAANLPPGATSTTTPAGVALHDPEANGNGAARDRCPVQGSGGGSVSVSTQDEGGKAMGKTKARRPRQTRIPGTEPETIKALDEKIAALYEARKERMELTELECLLAEEVIYLLKEHKLNAYSFDGMTATMFPGKTKVKVKHIEANGEDEEDEEDGEDE